MRFPPSNLRGRRGDQTSVPSAFRLPPSALPGGFTLMEVAICLAVISIALVAIIGVLPLGMNVQKENREGTIINQDATIFLEAISKGAQGLDNLTNYVYAITNYWTQFRADGTVASGGGAIHNSYTFNNSSITWPLQLAAVCHLTNGFHIIGLLSTPQFTDKNGFPIANTVGVDLYYSNHVFAYVRSLSGAAVEKPPQDNQIIQADAFAYRLLCVNAPVATHTPPLWVSGQTYNAGDWVSFIVNSQTTYWQANAATSAGSFPNSAWVRNAYPQELAANLHELRLTFQWPIRPNGKLGTGRQTYRTLVGGQVRHVYTNNVDLYFYQSQSFTNAP